MRRVQSERRARFCRGDHWSPAKNLHKQNGRTLFAPTGDGRYAQTRRAGACSRRKQTITVNATACAERTVRGNQKPSLVREGGSRKADG